MYHVLSCAAKPAGPKAVLHSAFSMEAFFEPGPAAGGRLGTQEETCTVPTLLFLKCSDKEMHQRWVPTSVPRTLQQNNNNIIKKKRKIDSQRSANSDAPDNYSCTWAVSSIKLSNLASGATCSDGTREGHQTNPHNKKDWQLYLSWHKEVNTTQRWCLFRSCLSFYVDSYQKIFKPEYVPQKMSTFFLSCNHGE